MNYALQSKKPVLCLFFIVFILTEVLAANTRTLPSLKTEAKYDILGIGTALTDLIIPVDDAFLKAHAGEKGGAVVISSQDIDKVIEASKTTPVIKPGGSCANTMKGLGKLGIKAVFHFKDGKDIYGNMFERSLKEYNVIAKNIVDDQLPSGKLACLVTPDANRTFLVSPSASGAFGAEDLDPVLFSQSKIVHIEGYALRNGALVSRSMQLAKDNGALVSFDLGCPELVQEHKDQILDLLATHVDILFAHEEELEVLYSKNALDAFQDLGRQVPIAVLLLGDQGCKVSGLSHSFTMPARTVQAIDTTGAGDLFASGFLYGMLMGNTLEHCAQSGNYLGSIVVQFYGAEIPKEAWNDILTKHQSTQFWFN